jgi:hypothetical protein
MSQGALGIYGRCKSGYEGLVAQVTKGAHDFEVLGLDGVLDRI